MSTTATQAKPQGLALLLDWRRIRFTLILSIAFGLLFSFGWTSGLPSLLIRTVLLGLLAMLAFGLFEQWPKRLPRWLARWVLQVVAVAATMPSATLWIYILSTAPGAPPFWKDSDRLSGFGLLTVLGLLLAPWVALGAVVRQKDALARHQALAFELERTKLEGQAVDARLRLLQAQVTPHFLFNTLANVQELVDSGSPQAAIVLRSLVAYLRASVPRLNETATTLGQELQLVQAYLELMHMRMPDRLQFAVHVDDTALALSCPPMTLLTLVENAVRHGVDPSEEGGRIDIHLQRRGERCVLQVVDTGAGLRQSVGGLGTGLSTLRERLQLAFAGDAQLRVSAQHPRGVCAEVEFPARGTATS
ncbi:MAG: histidine kinase [Candidatus Eisenbacteria bacterium]|uniref:Histidine kinase n=1 Tax=Eiseniibacteriota bacterium TaxID=2212470 RepID=A0A849SBA7_UNCEI|nr:histidine kinase [Candidatus Eisenbacteria bacterium]